MKRAPVRRGLAFALAASFALAAAARGEEHPNVARGFRPDNIYESLGSVDHVNLFNGNLNITIPIGQSYPVGGQLDYGLTLAWTGNIWDVRERQHPTEGMVQRYEPHRRYNAGFGWRLSLGHLSFPGESSNPNTGYAWFAPDGAEHVFDPYLHADQQLSSGVYYTRDGSYLRLDVRNTDPRLEFPDGTIHTFHAQTVPGSKGLPKKIEDRFGNFLNITYDTDPGTGQSRWNLSDSHSRVHRVRFRNTTSAFYPKVVADIVLETFAGQPATYTFTTQDLHVARPCASALANPDPDNLAHVLVPVLTSLGLPDGSTYAMPSYQYGTSSPCSPANGHVLALQLPTLGRIEWTYTTVHFGINSARTTPHYEAGNGVYQRTLRGADSSVLGTWSYTHDVLPVPFNNTFGPGYNPQREKRTYVQTPLGDRTVHYFSVFKGDGPFGTWDAGEYGMPFSREVSDGTSPGRFLSTQAFQCPGGVNCQLRRTTYVRYGFDGNDRENNRREESSRTVYHDDGNRFADVDRSDWDKFGHYRRVVTGGNFGAGDVRTSHTEYNAERLSSWPPTKPWVLNTYSEDWALEVVVGINQTARRTYKVNPATGWIERTRVHRFGNGTTSAADVVIETLPDTRGNLASERYYGGDTQPLGTSDLSSLVLPSTPQYRIDHTTAFGSRATSTYFNNSTGAPFGFKSFDCDIDRSTGLASGCRDTSSIFTGYTYDALGRLSLVNPQAGHDGQTQHLYTRATSASSLARVNVYRRPNGGGSVLAENVILFDALGRLWREQQKMPNGTFATRETLYNALGWKTSVSEMGNVGKRTLFQSYDPFGRPGRIVAPDGRATTLGYAGVREVDRGVIVGTTFDVAGTQQWTKETYDRQGRLYQLREPANPDGSNTTTTYGYDVGNRLRSVKQATSAGTQDRIFNYDQRGFLLSEQHPEKGAGPGVVNYSSYDARGHAGRKIDGPFDLTFLYDRAERLVTVRETGGAVRTFKTFAYGTSNATGVRDNGRLKRATRYNYPSDPYAGLVATVEETYTYGDRQGRPSQRDTLYTLGSSSRAFTQSWAYHHLGGPSVVTYPSCTHTECTQSFSTPRTVTYDYTNGWLSSVPGYASSITYHANGIHHQISHANGVVETQANDPNGMARPSSLTVTGGGSTLWQSGAYQYDGVGNVVRTGNGYYIYDRVSRLVDAHVYDGPTGAGNLRYQTYAYDPFGNLKSVGGDPWAAGRTIPINSLTNRLSGSTYDNAGNLLGWNGAACPSLPATPCYEHDGPGMMTRMKNGAEDWRYIYTADDERLFEFRVGGGGANWFVRDLGGQVLREFIESASFNWWPREYVYRGEKLLSSIHHSEGQRQVHLDHLGTPRAITRSEAPSPQDVVWVGDSLPADAVPTGEGEGWTWVGSSPAPFSGSLSHQSALVAGMHQHYFYGAAPQLAINSGDVFVAYVYLDPVNPPSEVMLQWNDGTWEHRAYWGANQIGFGVDGTNSRRYMGALPAAGQWVRLEVPASLVGLEGRSLNGMAFTLYGGRATWDHAGKRAAATSGGLLASHHVYFPFGEEITPSGSEQLKFTGHQRDFASASSVADDLDYMHARYYNPLTGRFLSTDPADSAKPGAPQTWNQYAYVRNNPLKYIDPDGRAETLATLAYEQDERAFLAGDIDAAEFQERNAARAAGTAVGVSLILPGPEDAILGLAFGSRLGQSLLGRVGALLNRAGDVLGVGRSVTLGGKRLALNTDIVLSGGRGGQKVRGLTGPPNSVIKGSGERLFITNDKGQVILDLTRGRAKPVTPGVGFGTKRDPTPEELKLIGKIFGAV